jgi:hypothetical protein
MSGLRSRRAKTGTGVLRRAESSITIELAASGFGPGRSCHIGQPTRSRPSFPVPLYGQIAAGTQT